MYGIEQEMLVSLVREEHRKAFVEVIKWAAYVKKLSVTDPEVSAALEEQKKATDNLVMWTAELKKLNEESEQ